MKHYNFKYLRLFESSTGLSTDADIADYLLEDFGDILTFTKINAERVSSNDGLILLISFVIKKDLFKKINKDNSKLTIKFLNKLESISNRWNLDYLIDHHTYHESKVTFTQKLPDKYTPFGFFHYNEHKGNLSHPRYKIELYTKETGMLNNIEFSYCNTVDRDLNFRVRFKVEYSKAYKSNISKIINYLKSEVEKSGECELEFNDNENFVFLLK